MPDFRCDLCGRFTARNVAHTGVVKTRSWYEPFTETITLVEGTCKTHGRRNITKSSTFGWDDFNHSSRI